MAGPLMLLMLDQAPWQARVAVYKISARGFSSTKKKSAQYKKPKRTGLQGEPTHSDVPVIEVKVDAMTVGRPDPEGVHRLPVVLRPRIIFRASHQETLLVVLEDKG